jgi:LemA protein
LAPRPRFYGEHPFGNRFEFIESRDRERDIISLAFHRVVEVLMGTVLLIILIVIVVVLVIFAIVTYNGLVRRRNEVEESYRQIDVQLKRRYDLIPNLLEGVKKYFRQEQEVLTQITQARSRAMQPQSPGQQAQSEARLSGAIGNLFAVAENYPELRSNTVLLDFQEELSSTENKISFARQHYNDSVGSYNTKIQSFPAVIFARMMGFTEKEYFEAVGPERESVTVSYD